MPPVMHAREIQHLSWVAVPLSVHVRVCGYVCLHCSVSFFRQIPRGSSWVLSPVAFSGLFIRRLVGFAMPALWN